MMAVSCRLQGELSLPMDRVLQDFGHDGLLWDPHKLSTTPRTAGTLQTSAQDMSCSMYHGRIASPLSMRPFDLPFQQQGTQMLGQYVAPPYEADLAGSLDMHSTVRPGIPPNTSSLLQSSSLLGFAPPASLRHQGMLSPDVNPVQQLQQIQDDLDSPTERIRSSAYTAGLGEARAGASAERAPTVRSSLQGSSGQKKKVPMHCQVEGCDKNLSHEKDYYRRYRICEEHLKLSSLLKDGEAQRFCQQCGRFHPLEDFDADKRSCRARLQLHNNRRRKRDEAPATRPADVNVTDDGDVAGALASTPADSASADAAVVPRGLRSSRKRRSPRSSSDGSKQANGTTRSDMSEDPAHTSEDPNLEAADASARPSNAFHIDTGPETGVRVRHRVVSMPCQVERSPSMQAIRSKLALPSHGIYRHLSSPPRQLPEGQATVQQAPSFADGTQSWRVQSLPAASGYPVGWSPVQANLQPQLPPQIHQLEPSTISAYLTALSQQTNMMLEVQNFDQQPQLSSSEAGSRPRQVPLADDLALSAQPAMQGFRRHHQIQPTGVMPAPPSLDNLEGNIAQAEALMHTIQTQTAHGSGSW
ncbi:hypothetical protein WJX84_006903 [Apatococcus fuscideae]|uniref:SBP-type domain-containing protein n=1 Tax=Apatococcus fuscideae TaxID=2026836 RepID=A0AAW1STC4_9CHLO